jgi:hypothetical protein
MKFVATKTAEQLDLQALLHRVRERLVSQRTGIINQIRAFMLERGIAVRQGIGFLRTELPTILATRTDALSPRMLRVIEELAGDWRRLDQRIDGPSGEISRSGMFAPDDGAWHRAAHFRAPWWPRSARETHSPKAKPPRGGCTTTCSRSRSPTSGRSFHRWRDPRSAALRRSAGGGWTACSPGSGKAEGVIDL